MRQKKNNIYLIAAALALVSVFKMACTSDNFLGSENNVKTDNTKDIPQIRSDSQKNNNSSSKTDAAESKGRIGHMNFSAAKQQLPVIFRQLEKPTTIYCGCDLIFKDGWYYPDLQSCGYKSKKDPKRASRIEAEHIMPAHEFGGKRECWLNSGRKGCENTDEKFSLMEGDLHNLYPSVGEVNGARSNYRFALNVKGNDRSGFGQCQMIIDSKKQLASPPERSRGIVARAYLYMAQKYGIKLSDSQTNLFNRWDKLYAPDKDECLRNTLIEKIQGNDNPFVTGKCKKI